MTASLDRHANNVSPPSEKTLEGYKQHRHRLRRIAGKLLPRERVSCCGQRPTGQSITLHQAETGHHFGGLETCGSVWACPVCASKVSEGRTVEVSKVLSDHRAAGGTAYMATLTIPHMHMQTCKELKDVVTNVWRYVKMGAPWERAREKYGYMGDVRALEVTHGGNGWHPHIHVLVFFHPGVAPHHAEAFSRWIFERWARGVEKRGYGCCSTNAFTFDLAAEDSGAADYVAKWGAAMELTKANVKEGKGGRHPFQILGDWKPGNRRDAALFIEYAKAFKGARQLTWAGDIRHAYREDEDQSDAVLAETPSLPKTHVATMDKPLWDIIAKKHLTAPVLTAADKRGIGAVADLLKAHGINSHMTLGHSLEEGRAVPWLRLADPLHHRRKNHPPGPVPEETPGHPRDTSHLNQFKGLAGPGKNRTTQNFRRNRPLVNSHEKEPQS